MIIYLHYITKIASWILYQFFFLWHLVWTLRSASSSFQSGDRRTPLFDTPQIQEATRRVKGFIPSHRRLSNPWVNGGVEKMSRVILGAVAYFFFLVLLLTLGGPPATRGISSRYSYATAWVSHYRAEGGADVGCPRTFFYLQGFAVFKRSSCTLPLKYLLSSVIDWEKERGGEEREGERERIIHDTDAHAHAYARRNKKARGVRCIEGLEKKKLVTGSRFFSGC